jgi:hypothetical protein
MTNTSDSDTSYEIGERRAYMSMLSVVLQGLGHDASEKEQTSWVLERAEIVNALREVCQEFGDNDWDPDLHLADVIRKHLLPYLQDR